MSGIWLNGENPSSQQLTASLGNTVRPPSQNQKQNPNWNRQNIILASSTWRRHSETNIKQGCKNKQEHGDTKPGCGGNHVGEDRGWLETVGATPLTSSAICMNAFQCYVSALFMCTLKQPSKSGSLTPDSSATVLWTRPPTNSSHCPSSLKGLSYIR